MKTSTYVGIGLGIAIVLGFFMGASFYTTPIEVTTAQCPTLAPEIKLVEMKEGWRCEEPDYFTDLLQPSGYWINKTFNCWRLEMSVDEFCSKHPKSCNPNRNLLPSKEQENI